MVEVLDWDEIDLGGYDKPAQPYIQKAIEKPDALSCSELEKVAEEVIYRACLGGIYYRTAAKICQVICQRELDSVSDTAIPEFHFRMGLISACQRMYVDHEQMRRSGIMHWVAFVRLMIQLFRVIKINNDALHGVTNTLFSCLEVLAQSPCTDNLEEVDVLCGALHEVGPDLEEMSAKKMEELISHCRDTVICEETDPDIRHMLMEMIELRSNNWTLPEKAQEFYYGR